MTALVAGVDLGGSHVQVGLVDAEGRIVARARRDHGGRLTPAQAADLIATLLADLRPQAPDPAGVRGVAVGVPGAVDPSGARVLHAPNLGWRQTPFAALLAARTGLPVWLDNDANLAAAGEHWLGAGRGCRNLACVTIGTGIGAGLVLDGRLYRGAFGAAGEFGHLPVRPTGGDLCGCGRPGCLETEASGSAIARHAGTPDAEHAFRAADAGDPRAQAAVDRALDALGAGLAALVNLLDPERIVLTGGVARRGEALLAPLRRRLAARAFLSEARLPDLVTAALGDDAAVVGAAALVFHYRLPPGAQAPDTPAGRPG